MKMTDLLRIIKNDSFTAFVMGIVVALLPIGDAKAAEQDALALRREYNDVSVAVDSLVRLADTEGMETQNLPEGRSERVLPEGMTAVVIFWADDEARVWLNDFSVGKTRLTPVEVTLPDLYFQEQNRLRARCWDTDWVESGFLGGLYLKDGAGRLYPVVVSNGEWDTADGRATEITYAHSMPDIPGAEPIWGTRVFGIVDLTVTFDRAAIERAIAKPVAAPATQMAQGAMDYHTYAQRIAVLQARRRKLKADLARQSDLNVPLYNRERGRSTSLSLGRAAPLTEEVSVPVAEKVRAWSEKLPAVQRQLIYPDPRALKGESAANAADAGAVSVAGDRGSRDQAYRPPEDRGRVAREKKDERTDAPPRLTGKGSGGTDGRAARLGLLLPTALLGLYVVYVITHWQSFMGERG